MEKEGYTLVWNDEFDGEALDTTKWSYQIGDGLLYGLNNWENGIWPAFWMLPVDQSIYGKWAASGELDIMEEKGRLPGQIGGTAHFGNEWPKNVYSTKDYFFPAGTDATDYHVYGLEWDPDAIRWYVDGECYSTLENWFAKSPHGNANFTSPAPFDVPFYIILNLAVGGTYDSDAVVTANSFLAQMNVDFVRVYHRNEGYEEADLAQRSKKDEVADYDCIKEPLPNKDRIYNGTFDEGTNSLAFWHKEGDTLTQLGHFFEEGHTYGIRFDLSCEMEQTAQVTIGTEDGKVYLDESIDVLAENGKIYAYTFSVQENVADAVLTFTLPENVTIDNVIMMQID